MGTSITLRERIDALRGVIMENAHHPERDQFNHTVQVTLAAAKETEDPVLLASAALHDIGKAVEFHGHEGIGAKLIRAEGDKVHPTTALSVHGLEDVAWLVENHLRISYFLKGEMRPGKAKTLVNHPLFTKLAWLRRFDVSGRDGTFKLTESRLKEFNRVLDKAGV